MIPVYFDRYFFVPWHGTLFVGRLPGIRGFENEGKQTMARVVGWTRLDGRDDDDWCSRGTARCSVLNHTETWAIPWFVRLVDRGGPRPTSVGKCARSACLGYVGGVAVQRPYGPEPLPVRWAVPTGSETDRREMA